MRPSASRVLASLCLIASSVGCGPKDSVSVEPSSTQSETQAAAPQGPVSAEALVGCRIEFEKEEQRLIACEQRTIMDVRLPSGFPHEEAVAIALGQTVDAIAQIQGVSTAPKRLTPVRAQGETAFSSFALEGQGEDQDKAAPVVIMTMPLGGDTRAMWCFPTIPFESDVTADGLWCEEALLAFASGANLMGATMQAASQSTEACPPDLDCAAGPTFAESLEGMQTIAAKVCECGEDQACQGEVHQMMDAWKAGPGMSRDPGTPEQNMEMGQALEKMMGCNTPLGLKLMAE